MDDKSFILNAFYDACIFLAKYNTDTRELFILKTSKKGFTEPAEPIDGREFIAQIIQSGVVYEEDVLAFDNMLDAQVMKRLCETRQNGSLLFFRKVEGQQLIWTRVNVFIPSDYSADNPFIVVFARPMPTAEATMFDAWGLLGDQVHKLVKVNLTTNEYTVIKEMDYERQWRRKHQHLEVLTERQFAAEGFIHPDDKAAFERYTDHRHILRQFKDGRKEYQFYYRRKVKGLYRWVCLHIIPTTEYTPENKVFYYYVKDMHTTILKLLDIRAATNYAQYFATRNQKFSEGYYENLLETLSTFTEPYIDYYLLDLEKDLYINYKMSHSRVNRDVPYIGNYTQITEKYLSDYYQNEELELLKTYSSSARLQELLKDKMTIEYSFTYPNGHKVTTTIVKTESRNGIPTKAICSTIPARADDKLIIKTFGNFEVYHPDQTPLQFARKQSKQLFAYLIDHQGYPVTSKDIVADILEKDPSDINAIKYVSTMIRRTIQELEAAGYPGIIIKEQKSVRVNTQMLDCDYYHVINGDHRYWTQYHNEYMKEYSWAEETNAELLSITNS